MRWLGLATGCLWLCAALPLLAQSPLPSRGEEPATEPAGDDDPVWTDGLEWDEPSIESRLRQPSGEDVVDEPSMLLRPSRGGRGMRGGPTGGGDPFSAYSFLQPESRLQDRSGALQVRGEGLSLGLPLRTGPDGVWILNSRVEHDAFETEAGLPGSTEPFPAELWNVTLGIMHVQPLENGWTVGGMLGIGSASDRPFASIRETNANVLAFLDVPVRERDAWNFSLFYSPLGQLAFPIPGVAYAWRPSEEFRMNVGLPFSLTYRPTETISFDLGYRPLTDAAATARWEPHEAWTVYGGYLTRSQGYEIADREDSRERLFRFDQRLTLGVRRKLGAGFSLDGSAAYLFDRSYFVADSFFGGGADRLRIDPGTQFMLKLEWAR